MQEAEGAAQASEVGFWLPSVLCILSSELRVTKSGVGLPCCLRPWRCPSEPVPRPGFLISPAPAGGWEESMKASGWGFLRLQAL